MSQLLRHMLKLVEPGFATNRLKPLRQEDKEERQAAQPHRWHSKDSRDRNLVKRLARTIATDLLANRFVAVHADGDVRWSDRPGVNERSFQEHLVPLVRSALRPARERPRSPRRDEPPESTRSEAEIARHLARSLLMMPYYTIEAWLYQNTEVALRLCHEKYQGKDAERIRDWQQDRARLDDEIEELGICLAKKHNVELASSAYPAREVYEVRASFHATVERLRGCADLCAALAQS
ncbi:MAG: hypothetical protein R3F14_15460 [Polyangiaceae bacterium]